MKKRIIALLAVTAFSALSMTACSQNGGAAAGTTAANNDGNTETSDASEKTDAPVAVKNAEITVISREEGSGTRGAFVELFGIEQKDADGKKVDHTIATADITSSTGVMLTSVAQDENAIGYVSLGSLKDDVKALEIDGVAATVENVKNGSYKVSRPFNIATKEGLSEVAQDFIDFILSTEGQAVIAEAHYIPLDNTAAYAGKKPSGKITVGGSSSVSPVMTKLKEAYIALNPNATIEIQTTDSTTGMNDAASGTVDIGMSSRALKDSELEAGLTPTTIATDGIAVIVSLENSFTGLTSEQVRQIYMGEITNWADLA